MKALTISQPFASLIASGEKFVENRSWQTHYRGSLAIHAGKGTQYMAKSEITDKGLPFGQVIAIAELQACVQRQWPREMLQRKLPPWCSLERFIDHEHAEGPWCWIIGNVRKLDHPVDAVGSQGLWHWRDR